MPIRLARISELDQLQSLFQRCAVHMIDNGIHQWDENYPVISNIENDILNRHVFNFYLDDLIAGTITINNQESPEYSSINWNYESYQVVHRLAVAPEFQGQGIARKLMDFAESRCRDQGYQSIRLDTFTANPRNMKFYQNRNYSLVGHVYFRSLTKPFACFEKQL